ncbi:AlwI family type II restriction endonuclease [Brucella intermedia]|uniref:AlwI family type II restriction endonuclease n=1 Tax=Brucella intermedia TaxID=94625 RepID=UPI00209B7384|nr:AlwI family type II restriction endonuclease [Brucella intermedia]MCO7727385.1 AlwI family type II restriction endonuclease [Brucella intermedia]
MMLWHLGNTTVRTPYRLRDGLIAIKNSSFNGNLSGRIVEGEFAKYLDSIGLLSASRISSGANIDDLGRKWRSAFTKLGFLTHKFSKRLNPSGLDDKLLLFVDEIDELSGRPYEITPNGYRLINSDVITAQQECFLRSLVSYRIPSLLEGRYACEQFSPLHFVLEIMHCLSMKAEDSRLFFNEFCFFVQTSSPDSGIDNIISNILNFRKNRLEASGNIKQFDRDALDKIVLEHDYARETFNDYADVSFRYLKATGLFKTVGRSIVFSQSHWQLISLLREQYVPNIPEVEYFRNLWLGAALPTDDFTSSYRVVIDLVKQLNDRGVPTEEPSIATAQVDLEVLRHQLEDKLLKLDEREFAEAQAEKIQEIGQWLSALETGKPKNSNQFLDDEVIKFNKSEAPVYLEWVVWRAFLAINSLKNEPWEARRFQIDQDFFPINCAPGGGPDMIFELEQFVVVVEVTLTQSSRQEAAEGEPVRRHVADYTLKYADKPVYGLFIAVDIDSNTAHTFLRGDWYKKDDTKINLDIVPITLSAFCKFFLSSEGRLSEMPRILREMLIECRAKANLDAPLWKKSISTIVESKIK